MGEEECRVKMLDPDKIYIVAKKSLTIDFFDSNPVPLECQRHVAMYHEHERGSDEEKLGRRAGRR
jgi:hypothetical protein